MMTKDEIMKVLDAMNYAISPSGTFWVKKHNKAKQILQAALAEPSQPVAEVQCVWSDPTKATVIVMHGSALANGEKLYKHSNNQLDEIAKVLHYPDCWDTAAYPTLEDAIIEAKAWEHCTNDDCTHPAPSKPEPHCVWSLYDDESSTWESGCGELWSFIDGGPSENRVSYCHHCGGEVQLKAKA